MINLMVRLSLAALVAMVALYGCGDDAESPTAPAPTPGLSGAKLTEVPTCGEETYLAELSPLLPVWQDSLEAWLTDVTLDDPPVWDEGPVADYLTLLVPVLQQWQGAVNTSLGSEVLAAVDDFDPASTTTQAYLSYLSPLLVGWKTAAETERGVEFLPAPPTFVPDTFAPVLECPADTSFTCADTAGVILEFEATAMDDCDDAPVVVCDPPSGSTFKAGTTTVTCTATDASGNESTCTFDVTVDVDDVAPALECPEDMTYSCADEAGVVVEFEVTATDECDDAPVVVCDPASGSTFLPGTTTVTCTATDAVGNESTCTFDVVVETDVEAPMLTCPSEVFTDCSMPEGKVVEFEVTATDDCDDAPVIVCEPASGSVFPVGTTTVECTATDASGNVGTCSFDVTVELAEVEIEDAEAVPSMLWPPNHKMVDISFDLDVENDCDLELDCRVLEVTSNEPINGPGDGNTEPDWMIDEDGGLKLRAERSGTGDGRVYTIRLRCEHEESGIGDETVVEVVVPHDRGGESDD
jgi:hypothetical protein